MPIERTTRLSAGGKASWRLTGAALSLASLMVLAAPAGAQIDRYDVNTGKYVTSDPFHIPKPSDPSPYRINPPVAKHVVPPASIATRSSARPSTKEATALGRPATTGLISSGNPAAKPPPPSSDDDSATLSPMPGMAMYDPGGVSDEDPFAKPDWWPK